MKDLKWNILLLILLVGMSVGIVLFKPVNLGLDLKGGISMVIQPDINYSLEQEYERYVRDVETKLKQKGVRLIEVLAQKDGISVELLEEEDYTKLSEVVDKDFSRFTVAKRERG